MDAAAGEALREELRESLVLSMREDGPLRDDVRRQVREELRLEGEYDEDGWLCASPLQVQTERERAVLAGLGSTSTADCVYRALFVPA